MVTLSPAANEKDVLDDNSVFAGTVTVKDFVAQGIIAFAETVCHAKVSTSAA